MGHGIFDNDESCKWVGLLDRCGDLNDVSYYLGEIFSHSESIISSSKANKALVVCEAIARLLGNFGEEMSAQTEILDRLVAKSNLVLTPRIVIMAVAAIEVILTEPSEILNVWSTAEDLALWKNNVETLRTRIHI